MPDRTFVAQERCVFCCQRFAPSQLKREHVVPLALSGTWVIPRATCEPCRARSNEVYESAALQCDLVRIPRLFLDLRRRNKKQKVPLTLPPLFPHGTAGEVSVGAFEKRRVDRDEYPPIFTMLMLPLADKLSDAKTAVPLDQKEFRVWIRLIEEKRLGGIVISDPTKFPGDGDRDFIFSFDYTYRGASASARQIFALGAYGRMLAKIAYCFGVSELKMEGFDGSEIRQLLRGERNDVFNFVGGSLNDERLTRRHLHYLAVRKRGKLWTVIVHLFSSYDAPAYEIVIGQEQ